MPYQIWTVSFCILRRKEFFTGSVNIRSMITISFSLRFVIFPVILLTLMSSLLKKMILLIFFLLMMPITFYWKKNLLIYQKDMILLLSENSERRKCILNIVFLLELQDFSLVIGIRIIVFVAGAEAKQFIPLQNAP